MVSAHTIECVTFDIEEHLHCNFFLFAKQSCLAISLLLIKNKQCSDRIGCFSDTISVVLSSFEIAISN